MAPPLKAEFLINEQRSNAVDMIDPQSNPPPRSPAVLALNVQLVNIRFPLELIPPPELEAVFLLKIQFVHSELRVPIDPLNSAPPPDSALFPKNSQLTNRQSLAKSPPPYAGVNSGSTDCRASAFCLIVAK